MCMGDGDGDGVDEDDGDDNGEREFRGKMQTAVVVLAVFVGLCTVGLLGGGIVCCFGCTKVSLILWDALRRRKKKERE